MHIHIYTYIYTYRYPGRIFRKHEEDGSFDIDYDDGHKELKVPAKSVREVQVVPVSPSLSLSPINDDTHTHTHTHTHPPTVPITIPIEEEEEEEEDSGKEKEKEKEKMEKIPVVTKEGQYVVANYRSNGVWFHGRVSRVWLSYVDIGK